MVPFKLALIRPKVLLMWLLPTSWRKTLAAFFVQQTQKKIIRCSAPAWFACSVPLTLAQDPSSYNLGTTVWDASIVLAKWLEKNSKKGELSRTRVRGKRAVELGAGMGLAGMALTLLGANVTLTDITDPVLHLLRRNVDANLSPSALRLKGAEWALDAAGSATVCELDWSNAEHFAAIKPPVDVIIAADCVYNETAVPHFLQAVLALSDRRTAVAVANEFRCARVHELFMKLFGEYFSIRKVPVARMDKQYQHPLIHIYVLKRKVQREGSAHATTTALGEAQKSVQKGGTEDTSSASAACVVEEEDEEGNVAHTSTAHRQNDDVDNHSKRAIHAATRLHQCVEKAAMPCCAETLSVASQEREEGGIQDLEGDDDWVPSECGGKSDEADRFLTRRRGAVLARLLKDVHITPD